MFFCYTDKSVKYITFELGFEDVSNFSNFLQEKHRPVTLGFQKFPGKFQRREIIAANREFCKSHAPALTHLCTVYPNKNFNEKQVVSWPQQPLSQPQLAQ
jgi:hypothetical protein